MEAAQRADTLQSDLHQMTTKHSQKSESHLLIQSRLTYITLFLEKLINTIFLLEAKVVQISNMSLLKVKLLNYLKLPNSTDTNSLKHFEKVKLFKFFSISFGF